MRYLKVLLTGVFISSQMVFVLAAGLDFTVTIQDPSCVGSTDGAISISPENGIPEYRVYVFGPGNYSSMAFDNVNLSAGEYSIRVEDASDNYMVQIVHLKAPVVAHILMEA